MRKTGIDENVIPSDVEGSRRESFKATPRDPSTFARDDEARMPVDIFPLHSDDGVPCPQRPRRKK